MKGILKFMLVSILAYATHIFGGIDTIFKSLVLLMIIDYITGIIKAIQEKALDSEKGFFGILKKVLMLLIIVVAQQIDIIFKAQGVNLICRDAVIIFYVINEIVSIIENVGEFIPIPEKIKEVLTQLKNKNKE